MPQAHIVFRRADADAKARLQELQAEIAVLRDHIRKSQSDSSIAEVATEPTSQNAILRQYATVHELATQNHGASEGFVTSGEESAQPSNNSINELSDLLWTLHLSDTGEPLFLGPSGNMCFPGVSRKAKLPKVASTTSLDSFELLHSMEARVRLMDIFKTHVNKFHMFLAALPEISIIFDRDGVVSPLPEQLLLASILGAGSVLASDNSLKSVGQASIAYAQEIALACIQGTRSLEVVCALSIMTWTELALGRSSMGSIYCHMAASISLELGLHVSNIVDARSNLSVSQHRTRAKVFWPFFLLDRIATSLCGQVCAIPWRRVRANSYTSLIEGRLASSEECVFDMQCKLWALHDRYMDQIYSYEFDELDSVNQRSLLLQARNSLTAFAESLQAVSPLRNTRNEQVLVLLHLSYHTSTILIHRPFLRASMDSVIRKMAFLSTCTDAQRIIEILRMPGVLDCLDTMPFWAVHHILTATISCLAIATSGINTANRRSANALRTCMTALERTSTTWPTQSSQAILLVQELAARWGVTSSLPLKWSQPVLRLQNQPFSNVFPHSLTQHRLYTNLDPIAVDPQLYGKNSMACDMLEAGAFM